MSTTLPSRSTSRPTPCGSGAASAPALGPSRSGCLGALPPRRPRTVGRRAEAGLGARRQHVERGGEGVLIFGLQVAVAVEHSGDAGVTSSTRHLGGRRSCADPERHGRVPACAARASRRPCRAPGLRFLSALVASSALMVAGSHTWRRKRDGRSGPPPERSTRDHWEPCPRQLRRVPRPRVWAWARRDCRPWSWAARSSPRPGRQSGSRPPRSCPPPSPHDAPAVRAVRLGGAHTTLRRARASGTPGR